MNSEFSEHDLEALLKARTNDTLPDSGFSTRVMEALPPRRHALGRNLVRYRVLLCTAVGAGVWLLSVPSLHSAISSTETTQSELIRLVEFASALWSPEGALVLSAWVLCAAILFAANSQESAD